MKNEKVNNENCTMASLQMADYKSAVDLYEKAFPVDERRNSEMWLSRFEQNANFYIDAIRKGEKFVGILTYWIFDDFLYIEHFATLAEVRGQGIGGNALSEFLLKHSSLPVVLEVEPMVDALTHRRVSFYERYGFSLSQKPYVQPSYHENGCSVPLCLMCTDADYLNLSFEYVVHTLYSEVYGVCAC